MACGCKERRAMLAAGYRQQRIRGVVKALPKVIAHVVKPKPFFAVQRRR